MQHNGTASWFIQGDTFQQWKKNGSLLWMRGNRMPLPPFCLGEYLIPCPDFSAGVGKSILWYATSRMLSDE